MILIRINNIKMKTKKNSITMNNQKGKNLKVVVKKRRNKHIKVRKMKKKAMYLMKITIEMV